MLIIEHFKRRVIHNRKGLFLPGIGLGIAALAGGVASLFGKKKKKEEPKPITPKPFGSLRDVPETQLVLGTLKERLAGRGVGFRPGAISAATSPLARSMRAEFAQKTVPMISAQASARGLGRSTIPVSRIALERGAVERSIGERMGELRLASEQQRRAEINDALARLQAFTGAEAGQRTVASTQALQERGLETQISQFQQQQQQQNVQNLLALGSLGVNVGTLAAKIGGVGGFAPTSLFGSPITGGKPTTGAKVNIGGQNLDADDLAAIIAALQGG